MVEYPETSVVTWMSVPSEQVIDVIMLSLSSISVSNVVPLSITRVPS